MRYLSSFISYFTRSDTRARATGLALTLLGMIAAGAYTLGKDLWSESETAAGSGEEASAPQVIESNSTQFNTEGERTVIVNGSQTGDISVGDNN